MLRSLRSRVIAGMTVLIVLVFAIAMLGVNSIRLARPLGGSGALAAAREHRPEQRPDRLARLRGPLGRAVPAAALER